MSANTNILALFIAFGKILSLVLGFMVPVVLVRVLDKSDFGLFSQFNMIFLSVATFFGFGFRSNLIFFYNNLEKNLIKSALVHTIIIVSILGGAAFVIICTHSFQKYILSGNEDMVSVIDLLALAVFLQMFSSVTETLYIVKRDKVTGLFYPVFSVVLKSTIVVYAAYSLGTFGAAAKGLVIALIVLTLFNIYYLASELKIHAGKRLLMPALMKRQIKYSTPFGLANSLKEVLLRFDKYIALSFLSPAVYASYSVAFTAIPGIMAIFDSLASVYLMDMVREYKSGRKEKAIEIYKHLVAKSMSFTIPLVLMFIYYADVVIPFVFTEKYSDSVILFQIYIPSFLFFVLGADLAVRATGKTMLSLRAQIFSIFLSLPTTYLLITNYGVTGAVVGALIGSVLPTILLVSYSIKILETSIWRILPWAKIFGIIAITFAAFIPTFVLSEVFEKNIVTFLLCISISGLIVLFLEYHFDLMIVDRENIERVIAKLVGAVK